MFPRLTRRLSLLLACSLAGAAALVLPAGAAPGGNSAAGGGNSAAGGGNSAAGGGNSAAGGGNNAAGGGNNDDKPSLNLDQCRNGAVADPVDCDASTWHDGNLNPQQAHYVEGESAPYRLVMENLPLGQNITVVLEYDVKHGGQHAIDFLTHYDRLPGTDVDPIDGVTGLSNTVGTFAIPAPGSANSPVAGEPTAAFNALPAGERVMTIFGGTISAMGYDTEGDLASDGNSAAQVRVTFQANSATAVLAWGGHIATADDWGAGNSAAGVSGAPYHMSVESWTLGNVGNTDRSMQADVVTAVDPAPAQLTVTKVVENDNGGEGEVSDFQLFIGTNPVISEQANSLPAGTYTVSEGPHVGYTSSIGGDCAADGTITLVSGQVAECIITNDDIAPPPPTVARLVVTKIVINDDGGTGEVSDFDLFVGDDQVASGAANDFPAGVHTVSEGAHEHYTSTIGGACAANGSITLVAGQAYECTITNDDIAVDDPGDNPGNPGTNTGGNPGTNTGGNPEVKPTVDPAVETSTQTNNNPGQPVQTAPTTTLPATGPETAPTVVSELPRTGTGVREQSLVALALVAAGLLSSALGRRRTRQSEV